MAYLNKNLNGVEVGTKIVLESWRGLFKATVTRLTKTRLIAKMEGDEDEYIFNKTFGDMLGNNTLKYGRMSVMMDWTNGNETPLTWEQMQ